MAGASRRKSQPNCGWAFPDAKLHCQQRTETGAFFRLFAASRRIRTLPEPDPAPDRLARPRWLQAGHRPAQSGPINSDRPGPTCHRALTLCRRLCPAHVGVRAVGRGEKAPGLWHTPRRCRRRQPARVEAGETEGRREEDGGREGGR